MLSDKISDRAAASYCAVRGPLEIFRPLSTVAEATIRSVEVHNLAERNKLGVRGVWITKSGKYVAHIKVAGKKKYLGLFDTIEKASVAYTRAAKDAFAHLRERGATR